MSHMHPCAHSPWFQVQVFQEPLTDFVDWRHRRAADQEKTELNLCRCVYFCVSTPCGCCGMMCVSTVGMCEWGSGVVRMAACR